MCVVVVDVLTAGCAAERGSVELVEINNPLEPTAGL